MHVQSLSKEGLKELLQKVIGQNTDTNFERSPVSTKVIVNEEPSALALITVEELPHEQVTEFEPPQTPNVELIQERVLQETVVQDNILQEIVEAIQASPKIAHIELVEPLIQENAHDLPNFEQKRKEKDKQITALKHTVKELTAKNLAQEKIQSQLEDDLEKAKINTKELTKKIQENESVSSAKKQLEKEIVDYKETIETLTQSLHQARQKAQNKEDDLALKIHASTLDNQEAKMRLLRLISDKKELEDTVTTLTCEKATLAARLQSITQKNVKLEESEKNLSEKMKELTEALINKTDELACVQAELSEQQTLSNNLERKAEENRHLLEELQEKLQRQTFICQDTQNKNYELTESLEALNKNHSQELAVCQACLQEQSHVLEEEQRKHRLLSQEHIFIQKRTEEQENHLRLLEQHLARRVKECALLSKQLDDLMDRSAQIQNSLNSSLQKCTTLEENLETAKKIENALRIELDSQANLMQDSMREKEHQLSEYAKALQQKEQELNHLRRIQSQFSELEALVKRSVEICSDSPTLIQKEEAAPVIQSQKDFFGFINASKPQPKSLFE